MKQSFIIKQFRKKHFEQYHSRFVSVFLSKLQRNKLYIPCLEVSLTTYCTLCCEKCANLMQYYSHPYHVKAERVISDIYMISCVADEIDCLRLIGGEPLLWPDLNVLLTAAIQNKKIRNILIITNGTLQLPESVCKSLSNSAKCKVSISNYSEKSKALPELVKQLEKAGIKYSVNEVVWKDKADVSCRNKTEMGLRETYKNCPNHFFSLLNGELHMCPRSAHGSDLGIFEKCETDFVRISDFSESKKVLRDRIIELLCVPYIQACNYCNEDLSDKLPVVETAKQCTHYEAQMNFSGMITQKRV